MATVRLDYGTGDGIWDESLTGDIYQAGLAVLPEPISANYISGVGVSLKALGVAISEMVDRLGVEVVLVGRALLIDHVISELMSNNQGLAVRWDDGRRLTEIGWWQACLMVRLIRGQQVGFPRNELWLMPLGPARAGEVPEMVRYVDVLSVP